MRYNSLKSKLAKNSVDDILGNTEDIGGVKVVTKILDDNIEYEHNA